MNQWQNLALMEEESTGVLVPADVPFLDESSIQLCAVGKILSSKVVNVDAFRNVMLSVWSVHGSTQIETLGEIFL